MMRVITGLWSTAFLLCVYGCGNSASAPFEKFAAQLPDAEKEAQRLHLPITGADLEPQPPVAPKDNAAPLLARAGEALAAASKTNDWTKSFTDTITKPNTANMRMADAELRKLKPALDLATQASAKPRVDFKRDWASDEPWNLQFPEYPQLKNLTKALAMRGALRAAKGDTRGALQDFEAAFKLAQIAGAEPMLISGLMEIACNAIVVRHMEYAATARPRDLAFLRSLAKLALKESERRLDLLAYLPGEVLWGVAVAKNPEALIANLGEDSKEIAKVRRKTLPSGVTRDLLRAAYRVRALQAWSEVYADKAAHKDPLLLTARITEVGKRYSAADDPTMALGEFLYPGLEQGGTVFARREAQLSCFMGLLDVLCYRIQKGRYPKTLAEAGFAAIDPFTGKPYQLRISGNRVDIYSFGMDRKDDAGDTLKDVVSTFPRR